MEDRWPRVTALEVIETLWSDLGYDVQRKPHCNAAWPEAGDFRWLPPYSMHLEHVAEATGYSAEVQQDTESAVPVYRSPSALSATSVRQLRKFQHRAWSDGKIGTGISWKAGLLLIFSVGFYGRRVEERIEWWHLLSLNTPALRGSPIATDNHREHLQWLYQSWHCSCWRNGARLQSQRKECTGQSGGGFPF